MFRSFIHYLYRSPSEGCKGEGTADIGQKKNRQSTKGADKQRRKKQFTLTFTRTGKFTVANESACLWDCGRKPERKNPSRHGGGHANLKFDICLFVYT